MRYKLTDRQVIGLRKQAHRTCSYDTVSNSQRYKVSERVIRRAITGACYSHLNDKHPPFIITKNHRLNDTIVIQLRVEAHDQHLVDFKSLASLYGVSTICIFKAIKGKTYRHLNDRHPPFTQTGKKCKLTDRQVIDVRQSYDEDTKCSLKTYAASLDITPSYLRCILKGHVFKHLNNITFTKQIHNHPGRGILS